MVRIDQIAHRLKKNHKVYSLHLIKLLEEKGFTDLRPSFLEILIFLSEHNAPLIKDIGSECNLKKQTMTSHLNELQKRGYIVRKGNNEDKRGTAISLSPYGEKFRHSLMECINEMTKLVYNQIGSIELEKLEKSLDIFFERGLKALESH
ncbi:MarR family transcriptional regulator [Bacteriovoracaceae bacterium]|nr:MarR family transcriptional regulator [Bacteriovoracaceae bacterium]